MKTYVLDNIFLKHFFICLHKYNGVLNIGNTSLPFSVNFNVNWKSITDEY